MSPDLKIIWDIYTNYVQSSFWIYPFDGICFASDRPTELHFNKNNRLHNDKGMSVKFSDGWGLCNLNGVTVNENIVMTPAEKLDPKIILNEKNVDIQREIIKKIGVERVLQKLNAKCLDEWTYAKFNKHYKLMELKVGNGINRKYMYYEHAELKGYFYTLPVPPEVRTAKHGFAWFKGMIERGEINNVNEQELDKNLNEVDFLC